MFRIIALIRHKDRVGKTSLTANLAATLASRKHRVLAVDLDLKASLTLSVGLQEALAESPLSPQPEHWVTHPIPTGENFDLVAASEQLEPLERALAEKELGLGVVRTALEGLRERYEYILLDCPPNAEILTRAALVAADEALVPLPVDSPTPHTLNLLVSSIKEIQSDLNPKLRLAGFLVTTSESERDNPGEVMDKARRVYSVAIPISSAVIYVNPHLSGVPAWRKTLDHFSPRSARAQPYQTLASEIEDESLYAAQKLVTPWDNEVVAPLVEAEAGDLQQTTVRADESDLLRRARELAQSGAMAEAHELYQQERDRNPQNEQAWIGLARTTTDLGAALEFTKKALDTNPANAEAKELYRWLWSPEDAEGEVIEKASRRRTSIIIAAVILAISLVLIMLRFVNG